jgi:hypothetical protein
VTVYQLSGSFMHPRRDWSPSLCRHSRTGDGDQVSSGSLDAYPTADRRCAPLPHGVLHEKHLDDRLAGEVACFAVLAWACALWSGSGGNPAGRRPNMTMTERVVSALMLPGFRAGGFG